MKHWSVTRYCFYAMVASCDIPRQFDQLLSVLSGHQVTQDRNGQKIASGCYFEHCRTIIPRVDKAYVLSCCECWTLLNIRYASTQPVHKLLALPPLSTLTRSWEYQISTIIIHVHDYTASAHLLHQCQALYSQHATVVVSLSHGADPKPQFHQLDQSVHNTTK